MTLVVPPELSGHSATIQHMNEVCLSPHREQVSLSFFLHSCRLALWGMQSINCYIEDKPHLLWWEGLDVGFLVSRYNQYLTLLLKGMSVYSQPLVVILLLDYPFSCRWQCLSRTWWIISHGVTSRDCRLEFLPGECHLMLEVPLCQKSDTAIRGSEKLTLPWHLQALVERCKHWEII